MRADAVALGPSRPGATPSMGETLDTLAAISPLGRANEPDEVAHTIVCLSGEHTRPITCTIPAIDAGHVRALRPSNHRQGRTS